MLSALFCNIFLSVREGDFKMKVKKVPCDVYSRVVGYYRPLSEWNPAKKSEFAQRRTFIRGQYKDVKNADLKLCGPRFLR